MASCNSVLFFSIFALNLFLYAPLMTLSSTFSIPSIDSNVKSSFNLFGEAQISSNGLLLTPKSESESEYNKVGRATYSKMLHLWDSSSGKMADFNTHFSFVIESNSAFYGEGLAFFLADSKIIAANNSPGGYMGLIANSPSPAQAFVAIEFDTNWSDLWDPEIGPHVGIDINNITSSKAIHWNSLENIQGQEMDAWITYDATSYLFEVSFRVYNSSSDSFITKNLTYEVDLRDYLPEYVSVGFTASTGTSFTQVNYVKSWDFSSTLLIMEHAPFIDRPMELNSRRRKLDYDDYMSPPRDALTADDKFVITKVMIRVGVGILVPVIAVVIGYFFCKKKQTDSTEAGDQDKEKCVGILPVIAVVIGYVFCKKKQTDSTEAGHQDKEQSHVPSVDTEKVLPNKNNTECRDVNSTTSLSTLFTSERV